MFDLWNPPLEIAINRSRKYMLGNGQMVNAYDVREKESKKVIFSAIPQTIRLDDIKRFENALAQTVTLMEGRQALDYDRNAQCYDLISLQFIKERAEKAQLSQPEQNQTISEIPSTPIGIIEGIVNTVKRGRGRPRKVAA